MLLKTGRIFGLLGLGCLLLASAALAAPPPGKGGGKDKDDGGGGNDPTPPAGVAYSFTLLGTLGGGDSFPQGINNHGDVVGNAYTEFIVSRQWPSAFLDIDDGNGGRLMISLQDKFESEGVIPPFDYQTGTGWLVTEAHDINDAGQIVVHMVNVDELTTVADERHLYSPGSVTADGVPTLEFISDSQSFAPQSVNNHGDVVGSSGGQAAIWIGGVLQDLGPIGDCATGASDVNDQGVICGYTNGCGVGWKYVPSPGPGYVDLGKISNRKYASTSANAVNNLSNDNVEVAGRAYDGNRVTTAFRHSDATGLVQLGTLGGAYSVPGGHGCINDAGDIVGYSETSDGQEHLFLATHEHGMFDLEQAIVGLPDDLSGQLGHNALFINNSGQVFGFIRDDGQSLPSLDGDRNRAFLLTPISP